jgi:acyl CoA:acetate/3-ketoacid CoA transferase beta subunit
MELVHGAKRVIMMMEHTAWDSGYKIAREGIRRFELGQACARRIITHFAVIDVGPEGLLVSCWTSRSACASVHRCPDPRNTFGTPAMVSNGMLSPSW